MIEYLQPPPQDCLFSKVFRVEGDNSVPSPSMPCPSQGEDTVTSHHSSPAWNTTLVVLHLSPQGYMINMMMMMMMIKMMMREMIITTVIISNNNKK